MAAWALTADGTPPPVERYGDPFLDGQEPTRTGLGIFSLAPDGSGVVYVGRGEMPGTIRLYLRRWTDLESTPIRGTEGGDQPAISPDGRELAFHRSDEVFVAPVEGGAVRSLGPGRWPHWDEAGGLYATLDGVGSVRYPVTGGAPDTILRLQPEHDNLFVWSVFPGERRALVLVNAGDGAFELHAADLETGELRFLTPGTEPSFVDTGHLLFRLDGSLVAAPFDPDAMELEGPPVALETDVTAYSLSRDGRLMYSLGSTVGNTERQLVWVDRSGRATPVDSAWTFTQGDVNTSWDISPDGSRLALREAVDGAYDIWVKQLDDGPRSRLTFDRAGDYHPRWSPDGQRIVYLTGATTGLDVWTRRADGAGEPRLLLDAEESIALAYWSPDAEWLVLRTTTGSGNVFGRDIRAFRPGVDSVPVPLLVEDHDEMDPALSPDGRWLAYQSNETGSFEVYVRPFPDVGGGRWQVSIDGGHGPRWAHDGQEIFFRDRNRNLVAAEVDGSGTDFRARSPSVLFSIPDDIYAGELSTPFAVHRDDQRFLMARIVQPGSGGTGERPDFVLVRSFPRDLKARVPS